jgi:hypothetical protein
MDTRRDVQQKVTDLGSALVARFEAVGGISREKSRDECAIVIAQLERCQTFEAIDKVLGQYPALKLWNINRKILEAPRLLALIDFQKR